MSRATPVGRTGLAGLLLVAALVTLRAGHTATEQDLRAFCRSQLTPYKVPSHIVFRTDLPKTMVGKILRRALRDEKVES